MMGGINVAQLEDLGIFNLPGLYSRGIKESMNAWMSGEGGMSQRF